MFQNNDKVKIARKGQMLDGTIASGRTWADLDPSYCDSQEVNHKAGRMGWGYKVRAPIVRADGSLYMVRGEVAMGLSYVDEKLITKG